MNNRQGNSKFVLAAVLVMGLAAITPLRAQTAIGGDLQVFTDIMRTFIASGLANELRKLKTTTRRKYELGVLPAHKIQIRV